MVQKIRGGFPRPRGIWTLLSMQRNPHAKLKIFIQIKKNKLRSATLKEDQRQEVRIQMDLRLPFIPGWDTSGMLEQDMMITES